MDKLHVVNLGSILKMTIAEKVGLVPQKLRVSVNSRHHVERAESGEINRDEVKEREHFCDLYAQLGDLESQADVGEVVAVVASASHRVDSFAL
jgi:hypothetical protein